MNEPTESAQRHTGIVTASALLAVVRQGTEYLSLHGRAVHDRASWSDAFVFEVRARKSARTGERAFGADVITSLDVPGWVRNGYTSETEERTFDGRPEQRYWQPFKALKGFWALPGANEDLVGILELLPADAEVSFEVALDAHTSPLIEGAKPVNGYDSRVTGLHGDALYLHAKFTKRGKEKKIRFLVDTSIGLHNSARFGF